MTFQSPAPERSNAFRMRLTTRSAFYIRRACALFLLLTSGGCAPLLAGTGLEAASSLISLGGTGLTIVQMTSTGPEKLLIGLMPPQYVENRERLIREAWEQNYQLIRTVEWAGEEMPWSDLTAAAYRKAGENKVLFALVEKRPLRTETHKEEITVYKTASGKLLHDPADSPGSAFYPQTHERQISVPIYAYKAWFFARSKQPSGILAGEGHRGGPCATAYGNGTLIRAVGRNTAADKSQLLSGDIVTAVNGRPATDSTALFLLAPGNNTLTICRNGHHGTKQLSLPTPRTVR